MTSHVTDYVIFFFYRGVEELGPSFSLPTCAHVFNIYHPVSIMHENVVFILHSVYVNTAVLSLNMCVITMIVFIFSLTLLLIALSP